MRSKRVFWSTLMNSASKLLRSSVGAAAAVEVEELASTAAPESAGLGLAWTCFLQYSMTFGEDLGVDVGERGAVVGAVVLYHVADGLRLHGDRLLDLKFLTVEALERDHLLLAFLGRHRSEDWEAKRNPG
uniref:Uncharacterized protein n=2 Tax=Triticum urartu TaxID=4572 RepID=A0A8R7UMU3_TRIUA